VKYRDIPLRPFTRAITFFRRFCGYLFWLSTLDPAGLNKQIFSVVRQFIHGDHSTIFPAPSSTNQTVVLKHLQPPISVGPAAIKIPVRDIGSAEFTVCEEITQDIHVPRSDAYGYHPFHSWKLLRIS